jgi:DNA-binding transcriptional ArsR family regulator
LMIECSGASCRSVRWIRSIGVHLLCIGDPVILSLSCVIGQVAGGSLYSPAVPERADEAQERLLKAVAHPLRHRVLTVIDEAGEASPKDVARALGEPLGRVGHHVRVLARLGAIVPTRTEQRRGATQHFYRSAVKRYFDDASAARLPRATRRALVGAYVRRLAGDAAAAAGGTGFDHPEAHLSYVLLDLDQEGMDAVAALLGQTLERVQEIKAESLERLGDAPPLLRTEVGILHFERD